MDTIKKVRPGRCGHTVDDMPCRLRRDHQEEHTVTRRVADRSAVLRVAARLLRAGWKRDRSCAPDGAVLLRRGGAAVMVAADA